MKRFQPFTLRAAVGIVLLAAASAVAGPYYGHSYALVAGIDDYSGGRWHTLAYARRDAVAVGDLLRAQGLR